MAPRPRKNFPTFKYFPKLPVELRLMIWSIAIDDADNGRIVRVKWQNGRFEMFGGKTPSWLLACKDSHGAALKVFPYIYANKALAAQAVPEPLKWIWVNFNVDTLYIVGGFNNLDYADWLQNLAQEAKPEHAEAVDVVRHLAFSISRTYCQLFLTGYGLPSTTARHDRTPLAYILCASHPSLKTITLVDDRSRFSSTQRPDQYSFGISQTQARYGLHWGRYGMVTEPRDHLALRSNEISQFWRERFESRNLLPLFPVHGIRKTKRRG